MPLDELQQQPRETLVAAWRQHHLETLGRERIRLGRSAPSRTPPRAALDQVELGELLEMRTSYGTVQTEGTGDLGGRQRLGGFAEVAVDLAAGGVAEDIGEPAKVPSILVVRGLHAQTLSHIGGKSKVSERRLPHNDGCLVSRPQNLEKRYGCRRPRECTRHRKRNAKGAS